jgi:hypothetical protein
MCRERRSGRTHKRHRRRHQAAHGQRIERPQTCHVLGPQERKYRVRSTADLSRLVQARRLDVQHQYQRVDRRPLCLREEHVWAPLRSEPYWRSSDQNGGAPRCISPAVALLLV